MAGGRIRRSARHTHTNDGWRRKKLKNSTTRLPPSSSFQPLGPVSGPRWATPTATPLAPPPPRPSSKAAATPICRAENSHWNWNSLEDRRSLARLATLLDSEPRLMAMAASDRIQRRCAVSPSPARSLSLCLRSRDRAPYLPFLSFPFLGASTRTRAVSFSPHVACPILGTDRWSCQWCGGTAPLEAFFGLSFTHSLHSAGSGTVHDLRPDRRQAGTGRDVRVNVER